MTANTPPWSARLPLAIGCASVVLLLGGLGSWSVGTEIAGAVVASGTVKVESDRQVVQHPDGGVVAEILARDGDHVSAGEVLIRLDGTFLRSELAVVERQLAEIFARGARLEAERDGAEAMSLGNAPGFQLTDAEAVREQIEGQRSLFAARAASLAQEQRHLSEQQEQIKRQIEGTEAQINAFHRQLELIRQELGDVQALFDRGLIQVTRLLTLQREEAGLAGEIGRLAATVAEARTRISGLRMEALKLTDRRREEAIGLLRDLRFSEIELEERRIRLSERLARLDVRAPVAGTVFQSRVTGVGSVMREADPIMYLVPTDRALRITARIDPVDIDQVHPGQPVRLAFTAFNRRTTPEVPGTVIRVSVDTEIDDATGARFYEAIVLPDPDALADLDGVTLRPGMPVETFIRTDDRTPLSYLTQPIAIYLARAFREE